MTLDEAIAVFTKELPGWWWSVGRCHVSADASCGPDYVGPAAYLSSVPVDLPTPSGWLRPEGYIRSFDDGFHIELPQPATCAEALLNVMEQAKAAIAKRKDRQT